MESATTLTLPRGFVDTTATDGRRLRIYYIRETPVDAEDDNDINSRTTATHATSSTTIDVSKEAVNIAKLLRAAEIEVIRNFAAAYTRGDLDLNGKMPYQEVQPVGIILGESSHFDLHILGRAAYNSRCIQRGRYLGARK
ncbi:hypothetical protein E4U57_000785 [Claviceps arundinis]|uniref:Uncharacterized protein n=1 Tax=Claviceps arundinis TaxID=1623583 RepID=A0ABQ7PC27_9HYPO|nr:hypothetical protein E4U57_000785 [Claviceps arundinis]